MKAGAAKRGGNPAFPYVAIVIHDDGRTHNTNTKTAFATREAAVAFAQRWIDRHHEIQARQDAAREARNRRAR